MVYGTWRRERFLAVLPLPHLGSEETQQHLDSEETQQKRGREGRVGVMEEGRTWDCVEIQSMIIFISSPLCVVTVGLMNVSSTAWS